MDVPVVAATGFEGDIHDTAADVGQITLPDEILAVGIGFATSIPPSNVAVNIILFIPILLSSFRP